MSKETKTTKQLRTELEAKRAETETKNKAGLVDYQDYAIYISRNRFAKQGAKGLDCWDVFKTKVGGCQATQLFTFETDGQAWEAAKKIAEAVGGDFYGKTDPRRL